MTTNTDTPQAPSRPLASASADGPRHRHSDRLRRRLRRGLTVVGAAVAAGLVWAVAGPGLGVALEVHAGDALRVVDPASVITASLVAGLCGWALTALLERFIGRARRAWLITAPAVLVVSLLGPFGAVTGSAAAALATMHVVVALVLLWGLAPRSRV